MKITVNEKSYGVVEFYDAIAKQHCESVCGDCFSDYYGTCEDCGEYYKLKDLEDHNGNLLCPSCLEDAIDKESEMEEAV